MAPRVIAATNAFTVRLFPEPRAIRPFQSQIQVTEDAPDRARGRVITCEDGPVFFNQPRGSPDRPMRNPSSRRRSPGIHWQLLALRDRYYPELEGRAPSAEWVGPLAFTPDQLPAIGFFRPGVVVAADYNGYGGSYTTAAGLAAAEMVLTARVPDWVPEDVFSPRRLTTPEPLFTSRQDSLWRIAESLCRQLKAVNHRIAEALALRARPAVTVEVRGSREMTAIAESTPARTIAPGTLAAPPRLAAFSPDETATLLEATRRWDLKRGTLLFTEGSPGGTCYILVRGGVEVSLEVNGRHELLARLPAGSVFGQVSLIDGEPHSATCTISRDAVLVELERQECERLLHSRSPLSLKLLALLNDGLISALRGADRRLMMLESDGDGAGPTGAAAGGREGQSHFY
jgi:CRP-like cAMP-binding protein